MHQARAKNMPRVKRSNNAVLGARRKREKRKSGTEGLTNETEG